MKTRTILEKNFSKKQSIWNIKYHNKSFPTLSHLLEFVKKETEQQAKQEILEDIEGEIGHITFVKRVIEKLKQEVEK